MRFQITQTHNVHDCKVSTVDGRIRNVRRMGHRLGYIVTCLSHMVAGATTVEVLVDAMNKRYKGASYNYADVYGGLRKLVDAKVVRYNGGWKLSPNAQRTLDRELRTCKVAK